MKKKLSKLATLTLAMPRLAKRFIALTLDLSLCVLTVWLAYYLRLGEFISFSGQSDWSKGAIWALLASISLAIPIFIFSGLYRAIFRYS
jgi:O-antigen/teichoic acid export membrane protein